MSADNPYIITILVFASVGICLNLCVLYIFWQYYTIRAVTTKLIGLLHVSILGQLISTLPYVYSGNWFICGLMGFLSFYFSLLNVLITVWLTLTYFNFMRDNRSEIEVGIKKYGIKFAIIFPLITLLPFTTNSYEAVGDWCTLGLNKTADLWSIFIFFIWIFLALFFCTLMFIYIMYRASRFNTIGLRRRIFRSVGVYILITILGLFPRVIPRLLLLLDFKRNNGLDDDTDDHASAESQFGVEFPLCFVGSAYAICFFFNQQFLLAYESQQVQEAVDDFQVTIADLDAVLNLPLHDSSGKPSRQSSLQTSGNDSSNSQNHSNTNSRNFPSDFES